jgi:hypothetical protein
LDVGIVHRAVDEQQQQDDPGEREQGASHGEPFGIPDPRIRPNRPIREAVLVS